MLNNVTESQSELSKNMSCGNLFVVEKSLPQPSPEKCSFLFFSALIALNHILVLQCAFKQVSKNPQRLLKPLLTCTIVDHNKLFTEGERN